MRTISFGAELLRQPFQERPLEEARGFTAVYDTQSRAVIFCLRKNGELLILLPANDGQIQVVDLCQKLKVDFNDKVQCFAASQSHDGSVYLAFATSNNQSEHKLFVLEPIKLDTEQWYEKLDGSALINGEQKLDLRVSQLLLSNTIDDLGYPFLAAEIQHKDKQTKDVARIEVQKISGKPAKWAWATNLEFPYNVERIVSMCAGRIYGASGIFAIDDTQGTASVTFVGIRKPVRGEPRQPITVHLKTIANARAVTTTTDERGYSNVLVGGDGILHIPAKECATSSKGIVQPTIRDDGISHLTGIQRMQLTQNSRKISIWALNADGNLVGQLADLKTIEDADGDDVDSLVADGSPTPLLPGSNHLQTFDAVIDPNTQSQEVFTLGQAGSVSRLRQAGDSKLWSEETFRIPDPDDVVDINTYACQLRLVGEGGAAIPNKEIQIRASTQTSATINGARLQLGKSITKIATDSRGMVSLILPAPNLVVPDITISAENVAAKTFNPATKAIEKLSNAASSGKLEEARRPDGNMLFKDLKPDDKKAFAQLGQLYNEKQASNGAAVANLATTKPESSSDEEHGFLWHLWQGIVSGVEGVVSYVYQAGKFIITTLKRTLTFIIETVEHVLSAVWGLLKLLVGDLLEDALTWLAELIDWEGVTDCMLFFNETFNAGIDMIKDMIADGIEKVDATFDEFEQVIGMWHVPPVLPEKIGKSKPKLDKDNSKNESMVSSPAFNWASNHVESDDSKEKLAAGAKKGEATGVPDLFQSLFEDIFLPLWNEFKSVLSSIWTDGKKLFDSDSNMTWQDILKNVGIDLVLGILRGVHKLIRGVMKVSSNILHWIQIIMNEPIEIWVVSKVFKKVTHGQQLTLLNLASLILAVPTNFMFKTMYNKKPRDIPQLKELFDGIRAKRQGADFEALQIVDEPPRPLSTHLMATNFPASAQPEARSISSRNNIQMLARSITITNSDDISEEDGTEKPAKVPDPDNPKEPPQPVFTHLMATNIAAFAQPETRSMTSPTQIRMLANSVPNTKPQSNATEKPPTNSNKTSEKRSVHWVKHIFRLGMMLKNLGKLLYSIIDCIATGFYWPALKNNNDSLRAAKPILVEKSFSWSRALGIFFSVVVTIMDFPYQKFGRSALGTTSRVITWALVGVLNFLKACIRDMQKPALAAVAGVVDLIGYSVALYAEHPKGDGPLEWSQRYLTDLWAIGSCYNGITGAAEPWGLWITVGVGAVMNAEALALVVQQVNYFDRNGWDEKYEPPTFQSGLSGSYW